MIIVKDFVLGAPIEFMYFIDIKHKDDFIQVSLAVHNGLTN